ncbi:MAG: carbohydrate ABC transporter permease, partial [Cellulosilyticaceae bacterium]
ILPVALSVWNMIIARTYIQNTIPDSLSEAAEIDGCSPIKFFFKVVLPLSAPILAVLALYYGVGHWNSYFNAMIYLSDQKLFPLQLVLRSILIMNNIDPTMMQDVDAMMKKQGLVDLLKYSVIVVASVPVLCIYPFVQKYFVKGVMIGALKG